jgi:hypothetical protein
MRLLVRPLRHRASGQARSSLGGVAARSPCCVSFRKGQNMAKWHDMTYNDVLTYFIDYAKRIRSGQLDLGRRQYALGLAHSAREAIHCGYEHITAVELGVFEGEGLLELCNVAAFFQEELGVKFTVYGFDNAAGLPPIKGYVDHPELWHHGAFKMPDPDKIRAKLPPFASLIIGDISETIGTIEQSLRDAPLGFVAFDMDLYSSTKNGLRILKFPPECYVPVVPTILDNSDTVLSNSKWSGEYLAINEFNEANTLRKVDWKPNFDVDRYRFAVTQIFDHPIRQGTVRPRWGLSLGTF